MTLAELSALPVINEELVQELYGDTSDQEMVEMQVELWQGIKADLFRELEEISRLWQSDPNGEVRRIMHRVAGYAGGGGLNRCCEALRGSEKEAIAAEDVSAALAIARAAAEEGMTLLELRFPHLATGE